MSRFEYLSVLVSIVVALGLSEVTVSWGRLLQDRGRVRFSWLHAPVRGAAPRTPVSRHREVLAEAGAPIAATTFGTSSPRRGLLAT